MLDEVCTGIKVREINGAPPEHDTYECMTISTYAANPDMVVIWTLHGNTGYSVSVNDLLAAVQNCKNMGDRQ